MTSMECTITPFRGPNWASNSRLQKPRSRPETSSHERWSRWKENCRDWLWPILKPGSCRWRGGHRMMGAGSERFRLMLDITRDSISTTAVNIEARADRPNALWGNIETTTCTFHPIAQTTGCWVRWLISCCKNDASWTILHLPGFGKLSLRNRTCLAHCFGLRILPAPAALLA